MIKETFAGSSVIETTIFISFYDTETNVNGAIYFLSNTEIFFFKHVIRAYFQI